MHEIVISFAFSLFFNCFSPLKLQALQEQYGLDVAQQGMGMLLAMLSKMFDSLQQAYKGNKFWFQNVFIELHW